MDEKKDISIEKKIERKDISVERRDMSMQRRGISMERIGTQAKTRLTLKRKFYKVFKQLKNRDDSSDFDDFRTKSSAATQAASPKIFA